jgi:hypothetical protein
MHLTAAELVVKCGRSVESVDDVLVVIKSLTVKVLSIVWHWVRILLVITECS